MIATTKDSIRNMLAAKAGSQEGLLGSRSFLALAPRITANTNNLLFVNFSEVLQTASTLTQALPNAQGLVEWIDALKVIQSFGATRVARNNALITETVLQLQ